MKSRKNTSHGFTLIELLTVIAIIGILAAILIPVVGAVRESARTANCVSNLRQIGMGIMAASDDYQYQFPPSLRDYPAVGTYPQPHLQGLMAAVEPYLERGAEDGFEGTAAASHGVGVWRCESTGIPRPVQWPFYENGAMWRPGSGTTTEFARGRSIDSIPDLSRFPLVSDRGSQGVDGPWGHWGGFGTPFRPEKGWHSGDKLNVVFGDASVRSYEYQGPSDTTSEFGEILFNADPANW